MVERERSVMTLHLQSGDIPVIVADLPLEKLRLDPENPRLAHLRWGKKELREEDIEKELESEAQKLMKSLLTTRGPSTPLIVQPPSERSEYFIVREGNVRLVCLRKLSKEAHEGKFEGIREDTFDKVPCIIFPPYVGIEAISEYLATEHVAGKIKWLTLDQALHVYRMYEKFKKSIPEDAYLYQIIANIIRTTKKNVERWIKALNLTLEYVEWVESVVDDPAKIRRFSYFLELVKLLGKRNISLRIKEKIEKYIETDEGRREFFEFIRPRRKDKPGLIERAEHIRRLPDILEDQYALRLLEEEGSGKAIAYLDYEKGLDLLRAIDKFEEKLVSDKNKMLIVSNQKIKNKLSHLNQVIFQVLSGWKKKS